MADLDVDLAELLLAALNGAGGHRPAARSFTTFLLQLLRGMTHLQSKTVALSPPPAIGPPATSTRLFLLLGMWNNDLD